MTATLMTVARVAITDATVDEARRAPETAGATLVLRTADGRDVSLPSELQQMLLATLQSVAHRGEVVIGRVPDELTSTVAAEMLGVSRPTLMKWAREGAIPSHRVGTHTRFRREDVLRLRAERAEKRRAAFEDLRELEADHADLLDD